MPAQGTEQSTDSQGNTRRRPAKHQSTWKMPAQGKRQSTIVQSTGRENTQAPEHWENAKLRMQQQTGRFYMFGGGGGYGLYEQGGPLSHGSGVLY